MYVNTQKNNNFYFLILVLGLILSVICSIITINNALPNYDGILYLRTATTYLTSGFNAAQKVYSWPFYPIIIALCSKYSGLSVLYSAYCINTIFQAGIVLTFLNIFKKFNPTNTQLWFALITIIIFPQFNEYRHYILRDFGFWFFSLMAINNLLNYCNNFDNITRTKLINIIFYYVFFTIAFLFRTEAIFFAFALPIVILFTTRSAKNNDNKLYKHHSYKPILYVTTLLIIILSVSLFKISESNTNHSLIETILNNLHVDLIKKYLKLYTTKAATLNHVIFTNTENSLFVNYCFLFFGLFAVFIIKFTNVINIFNSFFLTIFLYKNQYTSQYKANQNNIKIIVFAALITIIIPTGFLYLVFITAGRYYILSALLLLLFVPFGLSHIWDYTVHKLKTSSKLLHALALSVLTIILLYMTIDGLLSFGPSKQYIKEAGLWYQKQNLPKDSAATNNGQLKYFANINHNFQYDNTSIKHNLKQEILHCKYNYILLRISHRNKEDLQIIKHLQDIKKIIILNTFINKKQDLVIIIKKSK